MPTQNQTKTTMQKKKKEKKGQNIVWKSEKHL